MSVYKMLDGNAAAVEAIKMAKVKVVSAYPITPQTTIAEKLSEICANGELNAEYIRVESEHSAMSCVIGAQLTGVRAATASASVGIALMHEVLNVASGCRVPIVMPVVNRSLASPWSLWCDHQDTMAERDSGWIQMYCENVQDVFDTMIMAYRIAESPRVLTPVMVCLDGFFLSHSMQKILVPEQGEIDKFIGEYKPQNLVLDPTDPVIIDDLTGSNENTEMMYQQAVGFKNAIPEMEKVFSEFENEFGRKKSLIEGYNTNDADAVIVCLGSMSGTAKYVSDLMREQGIKVGVIKVVAFRPFPYKALREVIGNITKVAVLDRTAGLGGEGTPLWIEIKAALTDKNLLIKNYIAGLAGRDINIETIKSVYTDILAGQSSDSPVWIDCDVEHAGLIREVSINDRH
ncbi:pyruvate ferredoxin oxidoreductase alpha subunit [Megasphaera paucivorans]|uniref:Pyruvate ferredoxin oxidoreductase alpha subunit n=2 Tax=Megasphaera paucivorans TaxID=349095 RepID=A0A1H0B8C2_9FIRM|nr:pyruvate ferredoxin oxidoreductase alpha subunit [Megasphaera paucivorans]